MLYIQRCYITGYFHILYILYFTSAVSGRILYYTIYTKVLHYRIL